MKTENKRNWMVWAIVVLAVMNVSTLATIMFHQYQTKKMETNPEQAQQLIETDSGNFSGRYFRDKLNLNSNQMNNFRDFNPVFRQQVRDINIELASIRKQMLIEMAANNSDTVLLNMLSDSIGSLHSQLKKCTYRYYLEMKKICDAEQQKKLEQMFNEMYISDMPKGQSGKGGYRWRHGRQNGN